MDDFTQIVITAAATLAVSLVGAIVAWALQGKREHAKWTRERRFELYSEVTKLSSRFFAHSQTPFETKEEVTSEYEKMHASISLLRFVGPKRMWDLGSEMLIAAGELRTSDARIAANDDADQKFRLARIAFANEAARVLKFGKR